MMSLPAPAHCCPQGLRVGAEASVPLTGLPMPSAQEEMLPETQFSLRLPALPEGFLPHSWPHIATKLLLCHHGDRPVGEYPHSCLGTSVRSRVPFSTGCLDNCRFQWLRAGINSPGTALSPEIGLAPLHT